jgi:2,4-dienoyl-CoA reductase-like NADH-dependent reductase (Old Yellow Enzyme family)
MKVLETCQLGKAVMKNRIIRSATFEGLADESGLPGDKYLEYYGSLSRLGMGAIITGFTTISRQAKAMQPGQVGFAEDDAIKPFKKVTGAVHKNDCRLFAQLCHAGRQTTAAVTGMPVVGASDQRSLYFGGRPRALSDEEALTVIEDFGDAARRACEADFDGVQIHAAHGYLIHQFILPSINNRKGLFGINPTFGVGTAFLGKVIDNIRRKCGDDFPLLVKVSRGDDYFNQFSPVMFEGLMEFLNTKAVDGIEVSYGTMDYALNIFRGSSLPVEAILNHNPKYKTRNPLLRLLFKKMVFPIVSARHKPFAPAYNLRAAARAKAKTSIPVISVGGFRSGTEMTGAIESGHADFIGMARPFIREPGIVLKLEKNPDYASDCAGCNQCAVMCDSKHPTRCYYPKTGAATSSSL